MKLKDFCFEMKKKKNFLGILKEFERGKNILNILNLLNIFKRSSRENKRGCESILNVFEYLKERI